MSNVIPFDQLAPLLRTLPSLPRPLLARLTERMIERLDEMDGDTDLEPEEDRCTAGDDGCAAFILHGHVHWGASQDSF